MKKRFKLAAVLVIILSLLMIPLCTKADFGGFSGDSDYGGGGGGDSSWDSGGSWSSSSSSGGSLSFDEIIFYAIALTCLFIFSKLKSNHNDTKNYKQTINTPKPTLYCELRSMSSYSRIDPTFSASEFREKLSNLYVRFQNDWQAKDISGLRPYLSDAFYAQMDRQLDRLRQDHQTNRVERIAVLAVELRGWRPESDRDIIIAHLNTRIVDYVVDDRTGKIVSGSNTKEKFMTYEWTLSRSKGVKTSRSTGTTSQTCPYCGAHIDINKTTVCEYCDSVLTTDTFDWVVTNIKGISQHTNNK